MLINNSVSLNESQKDFDKLLIRVDDNSSSILTSSDGPVNNAVAISSCLLNILLQIIVSYLLRTLKTNHGQTVGVFLSLHLCEAEFCIAALCLVANFLSSFSMDDESVKLIIHIIVISIAIFLTGSLYFIKLFLSFTEVLKFIWVSRTNAYGLNSGK